MTDSPSVTERPSFYARLEESAPGAASFEGRYDSTEHTVGPWAASEQHGGPPTGLALRAIQQLGPLPSRALPVRVTAEILSPVPVAPLLVRARLERPGKRVAWATADVATMERPDRPVLRMAAWLVRRTEDPTDLPVTPVEPAPPPGTEVAPTWTGGYLRAIGWRLVSGGFDRPGPATVWTSLLVDLVDGERPNGAQHVAVIADSGNGLSAVADPRELLFVNTDLTIHLHREPVGPVWMAAETTLDPLGVGLARTRLGDRDGQIGAGAQALFVQPR